MTQQAVTHGGASRQTTEHVAGEIRAELGRQNLSSRGLATKMGVNHQWVTRRINSRQVDLTPEDIELIADVLNIPVWKLLPKKWLPRLDSNQQPLGSRPGAPLATVTDLRPRIRHLRPTG
jgi:transcriptional regulator with XRE-family HTH domain